MESMEKAQIAWVVKPWNTMEFHGKAWGKFHGNPSEQNTIESMGYLPCFSMLARGKRLHGKHGESMDNMGSETMEFYGIPWKSMGKIPWKSIGAKFHGKHGGSTMLSMLAWRNHHMEKAWRKHFPSSLCLCKDSISRYMSNVFIALPALWLVK